MLKAEDHKVLELLCWLDRCLGEDLPPGSTSLCPSSVLTLLALDLNWFPTFARAIPLFLAVSAPEPLWRCLNAGETTHLRRQRQGRKREDPRVPWLEGRSQRGAKRIVLSCWKQRVVWISGEEGEILIFWADLLLTEALIICPDWCLSSSLTPLFLPLFSELTYETPFCILLVLLGNMEWH